jgi:thiamine biosynthesis lipoprotein
MIKKVLLILLIFGYLTSGCKQNKIELQRITGMIQGSTYSIVYENKPKIEPEELKRIVEKIFHDFDMSLSVYNDSSIISRINRNENVTVDTFFTESFNRSQEISKMSDGAFDITVGPLVRAWGFGPDGHKNFDKSKLDSLLKLVGFEKVTIKNNHLIKSDPGICLDMNAIAQGYSSDVLCRYFEGLGLKNFLIEVGGEIMARGDKGGDYWKIGIDKPIDNNMTPGRNLQAIIKIKNRGMSTSGNYRKFYIENGIKYSHEIDPKTGYPARNTLLSATIIADDCATADGYATACMVMGTDKSIEFLNRHKELDAYLVYSDEEGNFKTWMTRNLRKNIDENISN